jgi:hypothetical protein
MRIRLFNSSVVLLMLTMLAFGSVIESDLEDLG